MEAAGPGADRRPAQAARAADLLAAHRLRVRGQLRPGHDRRAALRAQPAADHAARGPLRDRQRQQADQLREDWVAGPTGRGARLHRLPGPAARPVRGRTGQRRGRAARGARHRGAAAAQLRPAARPAAARPHRGPDRRAWSAGSRTPRPRSCRSTCAAGSRCCTSASGRAGGAGGRDGQRRTRRAWPSGGRGRGPEHGAAARAPASTGASERPQPDTAGGAGPAARRRARRRRRRPRPRDPAAALPPVVAAPPSGLRRALRGRRTRRRTGRRRPGRRPRQPATTGPPRPPG